MTQRHLYRVDKFIVPATAREEFMAKVHLTHRILEEQPGFVRQVLLEKYAGPGDFNLVTLVEWENQEAMDRARAEVQAMHRRISFDSQAFRDEHGIRADLATYLALTDTELSA